MESKELTKYQAMIMNIAGANNVPDLNALAGALED